MTAFIAQTRDLVESYSVSGMIEDGAVVNFLPSLGQALEMAEEKLKQIEQRPEVKEIAFDGSFSDLANRMFGSGTKRERIPGT